MHLVSGDELSNPAPSDLEVLTKDASAGSLKSEMVLLSMS